jgi:hypothetical protein
MLVSSVLLMFFECLDYLEHFEVTPKTKEPGRSVAMLDRQFGNTVAQLFQ